MSLRVLFFGTPAFALPTLSRLLHSTHHVVGVVTQPDRPRGRGLKVAPGAVKTAARGHGLPVLQPDRLQDDAFVDALSHLQADLGVVAAYGRLLPQRVLDVPRLGVINVHASLLPRWRGAAPAHRAILAGDQTTGVSIMRVVLALDAGPVLARVATEIDPNETSVDVEARLAELGAALLASTVDRIAVGPIAESAQDERDATYAARLQRRDSQVDWGQPARTVHNHIRGLQPWPMAEAILRDRRVLLHRSEVADELATDAPPGTIVAVRGDSLGVAARPGHVRIHEIQPEGRAVMSVRAFLNGTHVSPGDRFEPVPGLDS